jgi:phosphodiesterase/alkaline phosphatase D-like protein
VQINLSWTAATETGGTISSYLVERCTGAACSTFAQVGTSTTTSFNDVGLNGSTSYSYRVRAKDAASATGPYSNTASATTAAPTFVDPASLTATASGPAQVNLSWTAATETGGTISQYLIERCSGACGSFAQVGTSTTLAFSDTGLLGSTAYSYRVRATDGTNSSAYSNISSTTTAAPTFTTPSTLTATAASNTQINLSWAAATETGGTISQYLIESCQGPSCTTFTQVGTSTTTSFSNTGLLASTSYSYRVRATDGTGFSTYSNIGTATTLANAPTAPSNLTATPSGPVQINLSWTAATETGGTISSYLVERCTGAACSTFAQVGTSTATSFNDVGLNGSTSYSYRVRAKDAASATGPYSNTASATTAVPTFVAPANLTATVSGPVQVNLSWTAATETGGTITNYLIERCTGAACSTFAQVGTSTTPSFSNTGLLGSTAYSYRVRATDGTNSSGYSNTSSATTAAPTFTAPTSLAASPAGNTQINLSWAAATETGGTISQYLIERCQGSACTTFAQVGTSATTTFSNTGLLAGTTYSYRVRATDAASNLGPYSNVAGATTTTAPPPAIAFVQTNYATPQTPQTQVAITYTSPQVAGDLNVVVVGWNDATATVNSIADSKGNVYAIAGPVTVFSAGGLSQAIYYAKNIVASTANTNTVTVKFNGAAAFPDIRILEYTGIDPTNPLDGYATATGSTATATSAAMTTTNANDLIVGADIITTGTSGPGTGFTSRGITSPDSDIAEDRVVTAVGSYTASAPTTSLGQWIMQVVAFKAHP